MKIMLDCSPAKIAEYRDRYGVDFWQLRTPLTNYARAGVPYAIDNGCFNRFDRDRWFRLLDEAEAAMWSGDGNRPVFVWLGLADSIDGSGLSRFDHMLEAVLAAISGAGHPQLELAVGERS